ncbi:uncharacterized protein LOC144702275 [Wolffia australiana]
MGNCQAAEVASAVCVETKEGKVVRVRCAIAASDVMSAHPGHYLAAATRRKLLRPDDVLCAGRVYRLVSFEEVLKELSSEKLLLRLEKEEELGRVARGRVARPGQWRPSLQSISEI